MRGAQARAWLLAKRYTPSDFRQQQPSPPTGGPVPVHSTETSSASWQASAQLHNLGPSPSRAKLRALCAWEAPGADSVGDFKLPHHMVSGSGNVGPANVSGCIAGVAALNGARGGVGIPRDDRHAVYEHLARHLRDAGRTPPALDGA